MTQQTGRYGTFPSSRKATVYKRGDRLIVNREDTTTEGIPLSTDDVIVLDDTASDATLGTAIVSVLSRARSGIKPVKPSDSHVRLEPLLEAAGVRSWTTFVRGLREASVFEDGGTILFRPSVNLGPKEGLEGIDGREVWADVSDPETVGRMARYAIDLAIA